MLNLQIKELQKKSIDASAENSTIITEIIDCIRSKKNPDKILKKNEDYLKNKYSFYIEAKNKKPNDIVNILKENQAELQSGEILIYLYILLSIKTGETLNWSKYKKTEIDFKKFEHYLNITPSQSDIDWLSDSLRARPTKRRNRTIPEYAETTVIPEGPFSGNLYQNLRAPYFIEPLALLSPQSSMQDVRLMWPAQTGKNTLAELFAMYYIQDYPSELMFAGSNMDSAREWFERRIEPRAHQAGIKFRTSSEDVKSRRSGNRAYSKEFDGGSLILGSLQSAASVASKTIRALIIDEIDRVAKLLGHEGLVWDVVYARTQAWGRQRKVLTMATPTTIEVSQINRLYMEGDQRIYHVPCPYCKTPQELVLSEGRNHGLHWHVKPDGHINKNSIVYVCLHCKREIPEHKKGWMLQPDNGAIWIPQSTSKSEYIASFHINGIYSPFIPWQEMAIEYESSREDIEKKQVFTNLKMGEPFQDFGTRPKLENLIELRGSYNRGTVPRGVLYLTMAIDVQTGSKKDKENPPRLECEILGHGSGYRTYSIDYLRFDGEIDDPYSGAWEKLNIWALSGINERTGLNFQRPDDKYGSGHIFPVMQIFIDAGNQNDLDDKGEHLDTVFKFAEMWGPNVFAIKGFNNLKYNKNEKGDRQSVSDIKRFRLTNSGEYKYYQISTNYYKRQLYARLKFQRRDGEWQQPGFCDFPIEYDENYFKMLAAEEKKSDGSFHSHGRRNESLDCKIYNFCNGDVYLKNVITDQQAYYRSIGYSTAELSAIDPIFVLKKLANETGQELIPQRPPVII